MVAKKRSLFLDVLKGMLITLVVIGHLQFFDYNSRTLTLIYSFHMPAFLIIGGILSHVDEKTELNEIWAKKIRRIIIPYFIFYIISFLFIPLDSWSKRLEAIVVVFKGIGDPINAINLPLWFLPFYFVSMILFENIEWLAYRIKIAIFGKKTKNKNEQYPFIFCISLMFVALIMYISFWYAKVYRGPWIPFNIEKAGFCLGFVLFGKVLGRYMPQCYAYIKKNTALTVFSIFTTALLFAVIFISWYYLSMKNGRIDINARDYKNAFFMYFDAILGFIIISIPAFLISKVPLINFVVELLGQNSIYILAYHVPSSYLTHCFILPFLPIVIQNFLSVNSLLSVCIWAWLGILFSLIMSLIHKITHIAA